MRILVTGATGFIGTSIVEALLKQGHGVSALVRTTSRAGFLQKQRIGLFYGDITDTSSLDAIHERFDAIVHCAAYVADSNWKKLYAVNCIGTENICRLSLQLGIQRLIYLSSVAVVSGNPQTPLTEDLPFSATNLYGRSKIEAEKKVQEYRDKGLRAVILRPCVVYGEAEPHALRLLLLLLKFRLLPVIDGGACRWQLVYVKNVAQAAVLGLTDETMLTGAFFVADKEVLNVREIFSLLAEGMCGPEPFVLPKWVTPLLTVLPFVGRKVRNLLKERVYDISRIQQCGYVPAWKAQEALRITARYYFC